MSNATPLSKQTIGFHWLVALAFIGVLGFGLYMVDLPDGPDKWQAIGLHKSLGFLVLLFASARILWRVKEGTIPSVSEAPSWQTKAAKGIHHFLLLATVLMPVSGVMMSVGGGFGLDVFGVNLIAAGEKIGWMGAVGYNTHHFLADAVIIVIGLHTLAALKHHLVDKDATLARMSGRG